MATDELYALRKYDLPQAKMALKYIKAKLTVALSFCRLLRLGCPKQAFAKIATLALLPGTNLT
jgi:hypothetical protein